MDDSDEALMARVARGDEAAFRLLSRRHVPAMLGLARRILGNAADAEDVAQEVFVAAYHARDRYRRGEPFRSWLYRIAVNRCIDRQRAQGRRPAVTALDTMLIEPVDPGRGPLDALLGDERDIRVVPAEQRVDLLERQRVVAMVRPCREDWGQVEEVHAESLEMVEVFFDPEHVATVELVRRLGPHVDDRVRPLGRFRPGG